MKHILRTYKALATKACLTAEALRVLCTGLAEPYRDTGPGGPSSELSQPSEELYGTGHHSRGGTGASTSLGYDKSCASGPLCCTKISYTRGCVLSSVLPGTPYDTVGGSS